MRCARIQEHGERYKDGDLSSAMLTKIDAHLATCEKCRAEYDFIKSISAMFAETAVPALPEGVIDAVAESIRVRKNDVRNPEGSSWLVDWWTMAVPRARVAYVLVLAILTAAGVYMGQDFTKNTTTVPVAVNKNDAYPGINSFGAMQPGSIEKTYFELTLRETEKGVK
jgi:predicted anti-sigma-YlaC factor YlaD